MYNNDYIVMIDENGQPFIAHAFGDKAKAAWGSLSGRAVKYKDKLIGPNGKVRYIYDEVVGNNAKRSYETAQKNYWASKNKYGPNKGEGSRTRGLREAVEASQAKYERTLRGRAEKLGKQVRSKSRRAKITMQKYGRKTLSSIKDAPDRIKDKLGYDEREAYQKALTRYRNERRQGKPQTEAQREGHWQTGKQLDAAKEAYDKTTLAKIEKLQKQIEDLTSRRRRRTGHR
jgi:hypothetical protein